MAKILIVDDNKEFVQSLVAALKAGEHTLSTLVENSTGPLQHGLTSSLRRNSPDIVFLDTSLPDPVILAQQLNTAKMPFICMQGLDNNAAAIRLLQLAHHRGSVNKGQAMAGLLQQLETYLAQPAELAPAQRAARPR